MNSLIVSHCYKNAAKKTDNPNNKNFTAECTFCPNRTISGNITNSSNFLKHIQEQHPKQFKEFEKLKSQVGSRKRKNDDPLDVEDAKQAKRLRQSSLQFNSAASSGVLCQSDFDSALCSMIVTDMMPLATVDRQGFMAFCEKVAPRCVLMSRRSLGRRISKLYTEEKQNLISEFQNARWLSATADAWSSHKRAFMGVTVHYVDPVNFEMKSTVLGVRRFKHAHTGEAIAKILLSMLNEFGIRSKVLNIVTDNAANMTKAFKVAIAASEVNEERTVTVPDNDTDLEEALSIRDDDDDDEREVVNVFDGLSGSAADDVDDVETLPPHKACGNHTLNLLASSDSLNARDDKAYKRSYDRAMAKVQALSNAVSRSPKMNDIVEEITGTTFMNPTSTRWSSDFSAVERVVAVGLQKVKRCQIALKQEQMTDADMQFLVAYAKVMKPIVLAMNVLQGEKTTYLGTLIPTIMGVKSKLDQSTDRLVSPLVSALSAGIDRRFQAVLSDKEHLIASVLHPNFKLHFLPEDARLNIKRTVVAYVQHVADEICDTDSHSGDYAGQQMPTAAPLDKEEDLYSFMTLPDHAAGGSISEEVEEFLQSKARGIQSLTDYPSVANAFVKANSTLPSSAAVERLFSTAGLILSPRRCRMTDQLFDRVVFLKCRSR